MTNCRICGTDRTGPGPTCAVCGAPLGDVVPPPPATAVPDAGTDSEPPSPRWSPAGIVAAGVVAVVIVVVGVWFLAGSSDDEEPSRPRAVGTTAPPPTAAPTGRPTTSPPPDTRVWSPVTSSSGRYTVGLPAPTRTDVTDPGTPGAVELTYSGDKPGTRGGAGVGLYEVADPSAFGGPTTSPTTTATSATATTSTVASTGSTIDPDTALRSMAGEFVGSVVPNARITLTSAAPTRLGTGLHVVGDDGDQRKGLAFDGFVVLDDERLVVVLATGPEYDRQNVQRAAARTIRSLQRR